MDALIEVEPREDGFYTRFKAEFLTEPRPWIGPYPTAEAAEAAAVAAIEKVLGDIARVMLGFPTD